MADACVLKLLGDHLVRGRMEHRSIGGRRRLLVIVEDGKGRRTATTDESQRGAAHATAEEAALVRIRRARR